MNAIAHSPPRESAQIFLGDASVSVRDLNAALLHRAGQPLKAGTEVKSDWETFQEKGCSLRVIDYKLPGRAGLRLIVKLRAVPATSPVILTSITVDADKLSRNSRFNLAGAHATTFTAGKLLELAAAVLQIVGSAPLQAQSPALIESIERRLQTSR